MDKNNSKTISEIIEEVKIDICADYCKWDEVYNSKYKDIDEAYNHKLCEKCHDCPLSRL